MRAALVNRRWRPTLNRVLSDIVFGRVSIELPALATMPQEQLCMRARAYRLDAATLDLRCGAGVLYASVGATVLAPSLPARPVDHRRFVAFDPATGGTTWLTFGDEDVGSGSAVLPDGRSLALTVVERGSIDGPCPTAGPSPGLRAGRSPRSPAPPCAALRSLPAGCTARTPTRSSDTTRSRAETSARHRIANFDAAAVARSAAP